MDCSCAGVCCSVLLSYSLTGRSFTCNANSDYKGIGYSRSYRLGFTSDIG